MQLQDKVSLNNKRLENPWATPVKLFHILIFWSQAKEWNLSWLDAIFQSLRNIMKFFRENWYSAFSTDSFLWKISPFLIMLLNWSLTSALTVKSIFWETVTLSHLHIYICPASVGVKTSKIFFKSRIFFEKIDFDVKGIPG